MAVGVPETDVFAAADAVLARGERPTVERVRLELGRGSPARVGGLLDIWWARLAERLSGETRLPALPAEVSQAFVQVWQQAIHLASGVAELSLSDQRRVVAAERERVAEVEEQARRESATFRQQAADAEAAHLAIRTRLADLEQLLEQRRLLIEDLRQQRDTLHGERVQTQQKFEVLQDSLKTLLKKSEQERSAQEDYARGVEERAHREVDRAREESKGIALKLKATDRQVQQLQRRLESTRLELGKSLQLASAQKARGDTLEKQFAKSHEEKQPKRKPRSKTAVKPSTA